MYKKMVKKIMAVAIFCLSQQSLGLPEDAQAVMHIQAGAAELSQQTHRGTYTGGVTFDQGSTHLRAAQAITQGNKTNQLIKAIIEGDHHAQAHYWGLVAQDKPELHAYADKIIYYPLTQEVELIGHARVEQGKHAFTAAIIQYNLKTQHVVTKQVANEQTTITIHPESKP